MNCFRFCLRLMLLAFLAALVPISTLHAQSDQTTDPSGVAKRPNIVFVFSDDHALQAIGAYGSKINQTPNLDRIAKEGAVFQNSFCANSICGPSRACILTGKHSHINGFLRNGNRFDGTQVTFPKLLQDVGYQTALIGKWHLGTDPTGFDHWEILPGQGHYYNPDLIQQDGTKKRFEGYVTDIITEHSLQWLKEQRDPNKPFMLMCQQKAPHRNWAPHPRHFSLYKNEDVPEPETLFDDYSGRSDLLKENEMSVANHFYWGHDMKFHGENEFPKHFESNLKDGEYARMTTAQRAAWDAAYEPENQEFIRAMKAGELSDRDVVSWKYQRYIKDYLRCVQAVDDSVGEILSYLDEAGLADNTIVIYSSDQGFYLGEHGWYDKRWMFEESLRMPFLIRWPGVIAPGTDSRAMIQNIDYAPTFLDIAGAEVPAAIQGRSMVPMMQNGCKASSSWRDAIYYAYYENAAVHNVPKHDGVRTDQYKLMFFPRTRQWQLFDLQSDPNEMTSLHDEPAYAAIFEGLKKRYEDLRDFYDVNSATIPDTRGDEERWRQRDQQITQNARNMKDVRLAFLGDSITQGWEGRGKEVWEKHYAGHNAINLGIGGDRTEHVIWRLTYGGLGKIQPEVLVLMIGTNNTGHFMQDPAEVAAGVQEILALLEQKLPKTKIVLQAILPRGESKFDVMRLNNIAINDRIAKFADGERVHFIEIGDRFLESDGSIDPEIMPDYLHLSTKGYEIWAEALEPTLKELGL
ncbi:sulfatase/phosphatase domain-containing protein [Neorhodopirellula pilleata]|uniref:Arylsulfatase n=1 Tax=Neorhodopirellula pilleata TaxID=2714738 RepID=A0A5C6A0B0_9BACT|nr:sulfatase/phosphatase domain-containing protein [Neorhodopirellula pilleata]TWT93009.1 Arylsulfatase [Neorhodopirellula pilleata]